MLYWLRICLQLHSALSCHLQLSGSSMPQAGMKETDLSSVSYTPYRKRKAMCACQAHMVRGPIVTNKLWAQ